MFFDSLGFRTKLFSDAIMYFDISPDTFIEIFLCSFLSFVIVIALDALLFGVSCPKVSSFGLRSKPGFSPTRKLVLIIFFFRLLRRD